MADGSGYRLPWQMPASRVYIGMEDGSVVVANPEGERMLTVPPPPEGTFAWGVNDSATRSLAQALLYDAIADWRIAQALAQPFAAATLNCIPYRQPWSMSDTVVRAVAASLATPR